MNEAAFPPNAHHLSQPLVGRLREQQALLDILNRCVGGYGGVVLISGEAGIGKTTLVDRFRQLTSPDDATVLVGHCYDLADPPPYGPWRRMFLSAHPDSGLPAIGELLTRRIPQSPADTQEELFETTADSLRSLAAHSPVILIIEDIHWADRASLDLLRRVSHHARQTQVLLILTYREDGIDQYEHFAEILPLLMRESETYRINLRRLGRDDVQALVSARYGLGEDDARQLVDYLYSRAEGNPFFTVELMRELEGQGTLARGEDGWEVHDLTGHPIPPVVRHIIASRLEHLDPEALALLELASVIGQDVPIDLWQGVAEASDESLIDAIEQAERLHLASEARDGRSIRFNHVLTRETIYHCKPALRRRQQHRQIAEALAQQPEAGPEDIAHHFVLADDPHGVEWLIRAGEQAEQLHAAHDAVARITRAIDLASRYQAEVPPNAYRVRARALETIGEFDSALQDLEHAVIMARNMDDLACEQEALSDLGMLWSGKDYIRAGECYEQALDVATRMNDQSAIARSLNRMANQRANIGELQSAIELHRRALDILEEDGDVAGLLETHDLLGTSCFLAGDYQEALSHLELAISEARRIGDRARLASALTMIPIFGGNLVTNFEAGVATARDPAYWLSCANEGLEIAREAGWKAGESFALSTLGAITAARGDLGRGLNLVEQGYSLARTIGHQQWLAFASFVLGLVWDELEDPKRAEVNLARCRATAEAIGSHHWTTLARTTSGFVQLKMGDVAGAAEFLNPLFATERAGRSNTQRSYQYVLAHWYLADGKPQAALDAAETLLSLEHDPSVTRGIPQVLKLKADALAALRLVAEADRAYRDAEHAAGVLELDFISWRIKAAHSQLLHLNGDIEATTVANEAAELVKGISETIPDTDVRARFVQRASRQIPQISDQRTNFQGRLGLSDREIDVLRLTAQGFTNVEIGSRLFISPRTVAQHLQSIYGKLGVNSRTAATAFAYQHDLV